MSQVNKNRSTIWLTVLGTLFALLVCIAATGMILLIYPQSERFIQLLVSPVNNQPGGSLKTTFDNQPTPFLPLPTQTPAPPTDLPPALKLTQAATPATISKPGPIESDDLPPASSYISGVYGTPQLYTLDCESQAAVDWARFFGVTINKHDFIKRLPLSDDPETGFVGNINGPMGKIPPGDYGVYPGPIASLLQEYGLNAAPVENWNIKALKNEIAAGRPVIVWIVNLPFAVNPQEYTASNGNTTIVAPFQHTWIVTGYNTASFTVIDSEWTYNVLTQTFIERWDALGNRAIVLIPEE